MKGAKRRERSRWCEAEASGMANEWQGHKEPGGQVQMQRCQPSAGMMGDRGRRPGKLAGKARDQGVGYRRRVPEGG